MTREEAINARVAEILAEWPETTDEQRSQAVRILASGRRATPTKAVTALPRIPAQRRAAA